MINLREMKRMVACDGLDGAQATLSEAIQRRHLKPEDFSVRDLAEAMVPDGAEWVRSLDPRHEGGFVSIQESNAVNTGAFSSIIGQVVYSKLLETYAAPEFTFSSLIPNVPTRLNGERIPGIGQIGDKASIVGEGQPYSSAGLNEDYIDTPVTTKRGLKVPVTKEVIFFDRTNLILNRAAEVGTMLGVNKEKRLINMVIGVTNNYKWKGTAYNTFQASTPWINVKTGNTLVDWNNADASHQIFYAITDPNTGEPIVINPKHVAVNRAYLRAAERAFVSEDTRVTTPGFNTSGNPMQTNVRNPYASKGYMVIDNPWFNAAQTAASQDARYWYHGDFTKAFAYMENWPITVVQAPQNHPDEFDRDIITQFKASERGAETVINPRYVVQNQQ